MALLETKREAEVWIRFNLEEMSHFAAFAVTPVVPGGYIRGKNKLK
jgi:hypothetical protein